MRIVNILIIPRMINAVVLKSQNACRTAAQPHLPLLALNVKSLWMISMICVVVQSKLVIKKYVQTIKFQNVMSVKEQFGQMTLVGVRSLDVSPFHLHQQRNLLSVKIVGL